MKRRSQKRILFLLFCIAIAASLILFKDRSNELHDDLAKQTPEQTTSLVSFQEPVEIKPALKKIEIGLEAVHHRRLPSNVERLGLKKSSTAVKKTKDTKSIFQINGQTLYLLPNLAAVRTKKNQSQKLKNQK